MKIRTTKAKKEVIILPNNTELPLEKTIVNRNFTVNANGQFVVTKDYPIKNRFIPENEIEKIMQSDLWTKDMPDLAKDTGFAIVILSDESEDRDGDTILCKGWDITDNSQMPSLYGHNRNNQKELIGKYDRLWTENEKLFGRVIFSRKLSAQETRQDILDGIITELSVAFIAHEFEYKKDANGNVKGYLFTKTEPVEGSFVPVPSNKNTSIPFAKEFNSDQPQPILKEIPIIMPDNTENKLVEAHPITFTLPQEVTDVLKSLSDSNKDLMDTVRKVMTENDNLKKAAESDEVTKAVNIPTYGSSPLDFSSRGSQGFVRECLQLAPKQLSPNSYDYQTMNIAGKSMTHEQKYAMGLYGLWLKAQWGDPQVRKPIVEDVEKIEKLCAGYIEKTSVTTTTPGSVLLLYDFLESWVKILDIENPVLAKCTQWSVADSQGNSGKIPVEKSVVTCKRTTETSKIATADPDYTKKEWNRKTIAVISKYTDEMVTGNPFQYGMLSAQWQARGVAELLAYEMVWNDGTTGLQGFWTSPQKAKYTKNPFFTDGTNDVWIDTAGGKAGTLKATTFGAFLTAKYSILQRYHKRIVCMAHPYVEAAILGFQNATTEGFVIQNPAQEGLPQKIWNVPMYYNDNIPVKSYMENPKGDGDDKNAVEYYNCLVLFDPTFYWYIRMGELKVDATSSAYVDGESMFETRQNAVRTIIQNDGIMASSVAMARLKGIDNWK